MKYIPYIHIYMNVATMGDPQIIDHFLFGKPRVKKSIPVLRKTHLHTNQYQDGLVPNYCISWCIPKRRFHDENRFSTKQFSSNSEVQCFQRNLYQVAKSTQYSHPPFKNKTPPRNHGKMWVKPKSFHIWGPSNVSVFSHGGKGSSHPISHSNFQPKMVIIIIIHHIYPMIII